MSSSSTRRDSSTANANGSVEPEEQALAGALPQRDNFDRREHHVFHPAPGETLRCGLFINAPAIGGVAEAGMLTAFD